MFKDLTNINDKLKSITRKNFISGIKQILLGIGGFVLIMGFWWVFINYIGRGRIPILAFILPFTTIIYAFKGIIKVICCRGEAEKLKNAFLLNFRKYKIDDFTLKEIDAEFGKNDDDFVIASDYLISISGTIVKLDEIDYINLWVREDKDSKRILIILEVNLKDSPIKMIVNENISDDLAKTIIDSEGNTDFGKNIAGKLQQANVEFRFMK